MVVIRHNFGISRILKRLYLSPAAHHVWKLLYNYSYNICILIQRRILHNYSVQNWYQYCLHVDVIQYELSNYSKPYILFALLDHIHICQTSCKQHINLHSMFNYIYLLDTNLELCTNSIKTYADTTIIYIFYIYHWWLFDHFICVLHAYLSDIVIVNFSFVLNQRIWIIFCIYCILINILDSIDAVHCNVNKDCNRNWCVFNLWPHCFLHIACNWCSYVFYQWNRVIIVMEQSIH